MKGWGGRELGGEGTRAADLNLLQGCSVIHDIVKKICENNEELTEQLLLSRLFFTFSFYSGLNYSTAL